MRASDQDPATERAIRVLLVVHDPEAQKQLRSLLETEDDRFELAHLADLEEALTSLQGDTYDVALLDLAMPGASAREALERARVASDAIPLVVLSDDSEPGLAVDALRQGAQDCLAYRELDAALLRRSLRHAVERHRMLRSLQEARAREHYMATHDTLTGLPNRHAFLAGLESSLASAQRYGRQVALLFFDLDGFKAVNDALGHEAGDLLLAEVGERMRRVTRRSDLVARLGGDEFVVALRDIESPRSVMCAAEHFIEALSQAYQLHGQECWVGASVGVALFPGDATDPEALIRASDLAMYHAKRHETHRVRFYEAEMDREVQERFALVASVREATRRGQLFLEFQPQIDVTTERMLGAEALLRWRHPERGLLAPAEFIGIAEDTGMMQEIGRWVLHEACGAAARWGPRPGDPSVAVNLSKRQLTDPHFVRDVAAALQAAELAPARLVLELNESGMVDLSKGAHASLRELAELGVTLAIDHFGTGAGSLALLETLPIRVLKIDDSLLRGATSGRRAHTIVAALIVLSRKLGIHTVALGVESVDQLRTLRALGCNRMQGYLLAVPISGRALESELGDDSPSWRELLTRADVRSTRPVDTPPR